MIVCFTGHRPQKLGGYIVPNKTYLQCKSAIIKALKFLKPELAISGMAQGVDLWAAEECINLKIPFMAAIPFDGHELIWPEESIKNYNDILSKAKEKQIVSEGGYMAWKLNKRNEWMVDRSDMVISIWDGSPSGTANCINYAVEKGKMIYIIDPKNNCEATVRRQT